MSMIMFTTTICKQLSIFVKQHVCYCWCTVVYLIVRRKLVFNFKLTTLCGYCMMWLSICSLKVNTAPHMRLTQRNNHANISELLDNLLRGYDNSIRPGFGGEYINISERKREEKRT